MRPLPFAYLFAVVLVSAVILTSGSLLVVRSGSMEPTIQAGDVIVTRALLGPVAPGEIVTFQRDADLITHRVIEVLPEGVRTQGDANPVADPYITAQPALRRVYWFRIPYLGYFLAFLNTRPGWFLAVVLPALLIILGETLAIIRAILVPPAAQGHA